MAHESFTSASRLRTASVAPKTATNAAPMPFVAPNENDPLNLCGNNAHQLMTVADFRDASHWLQLAKKRPYRLPERNCHCDAASMAWWLERMEITIPVYLETTGLKSLDEFQKLNPQWPLTAWIGTVMELYDERMASGGHP